MAMCGSRSTAKNTVSWARQDAGLSRRAFGGRVGVSHQQIAKLENPDENPYGYTPNTRTPGKNERSRSRSEISLV